MEPNELYNHYKAAMNGEISAEEWIGHLETVAQCELDRLTTLNQAELLKYASETRACYHEQWCKTMHLQEEITVMIEAGKKVVELLKTVEKAALDAKGDQEILMKIRTAYQA